MDKITIVHARRFLWRQNKEFQTGIFVEIPRHKWPLRILNSPLSKAFRSREFLVQIFEGEVTRLSICRTELNTDGMLKDGISWDDLQKIKNCVGYADCDAVEAHPKQSDVVNVANMRHLWIVGPEYTKFFWRTKSGSGFASGKSGEELLGIK